MHAKCSDRQAYEIPVVKCEATEDFGKCNRCRKNIPLDDPMFRSRDKVGKSYVRWHEDCRHQILAVIREADREEADMESDEETIRFVGEASGVMLFEDSAGTFKKVYIEL